MNEGHNPHWHGNKPPNRITFRFDDICINANMDHANKIAEILVSFFGCEILYAISPLVQNTGNERVFPKIQNAYSDHTLFYHVDKCGIPEVPDFVKVVSHGMVHCDHRLMDYAAQELSILTSCSILKAKTFVPPFNKWNSFTEEICKRNGIELVKFEDGWRCMEYEPYSEETKLWYLHARELTIEQIKNWLP